MVEFKFKEYEHITEITDVINQIMEISENKLKIKWYNVFFEFEEYVLFLTNFAFYKNSMPIIRTLETETEIGHVYIKYSEPLLNSNLNSYLRVKLFDSTENIWATEKFLYYFETL